MLNILLSVRTESSVWCVPASFCVFGVSNHIF